MFIYCPPSSKALWMVVNLQLLLCLAVPVLLPFLTEFDLVLHELQCIL